MDGWAFRREQLSDPALADIPVVIISAGGERYTKVDRLGIEVVLQKPVPLDALRAAVEQYGGVLNRSRPFRGEVYREPRPVI